MHGCITQKFGKGRPDAEMKRRKPVSEEACMDREIEVVSLARGGSSAKMSGLLNNQRESDEYEIQVDIRQEA